MKKQVRVQIDTNDESVKHIEVVIHPKGSGTMQDYREHDTYIRVHRRNDDAVNDDLVSFTDTSLNFTKTGRLKKHIKNRIIEICCNDEQTITAVIALIETLAV